LIAAHESQLGKIMRAAHERAADHEAIREPDGLPIGWSATLDLVRVYRNCYSAAPDEGDQRMKQDQKTLKSTA
jgi:hypothetical protein